MKFLEFFGICFHNWRIIDSGTVVNEYRGKIGSWHTLQCQKCGKLKDHKFLA